MSLGNVSSFLDIYLEYELSKGTITESFAQELIDQFVIKLRMVRHLRMQSYNDIFAGDPTLGNRISGRTSQRRTYQSDKDLLPFPADIVQPRPFTGTEPDRTLEPGTSRKDSKNSVQRFLSTLLLSSTKTTT